jgi:hypothetical protein
VQHEKASEKIFLGNVHTNILWGFLFPWRHCEGNKLSWNVTHMALL